SRTVSSRSFSRWFILLCSSSIRRENSSCSFWETNSSIFITPSLFLYIICVRIWTAVILEQIQLLLYLFQALCWSAFHKKQKIIYHGPQPRYNLKRAHFQQTRQA